MSRLRSSFGLSAVYSLFVCLLLTGCSSLNVGSGTSLQNANANAMQGRVQGGSQPVAGASVQLYAVGTTGDGSAATPLLATPAITNSNGAFSITGQYICPSASSLVYLVATGGNPGLGSGANNPTLALMTALGPCGNLTPSTFIVTNELTTVAAVWALAPYMTSYSSIGSTPADAAALASAFALSSMYVNPSTGASPGINVPAGATVPVAELNTLASILMVCVNSAGGVGGDGSSCGTLLSAATPPTGTAPTNAIAAALNIANNPQANVSTLFSLVSPISPFQPTLTAAPANYIVQLTAAGGGLSISPAAITFPSTYVSFLSASQTVTIANPSSNPIGFGQYGVYVGGVNSQDFPIVQNNCGVYLPAGATCTVSLAFTPVAAGQRNAALVINSTANFLQYVQLTGAGTAGTDAPLTLSPSSLNFTLAGVPQTVTVTNASSGSVTIGNILVDSLASQTNNCPQVLDAQSICTISVQAVSLQASTPHSGNLTITSSTPSSPQTVPINVAAGLATFSAAPVDFGSWAVGFPSPIQQVFARAGSFSQTVSLDGSVTGPNASDFSIFKSCGPSYLCIMNITFTPGGTGSRTATLVTNYGNVALSGNGIPPGPSFTISPANISSPINTGTTTNLVLQNNGSTIISPSSATITGPNASDFSVTDGCNTNLSPQGSCSSLTIVFTPAQLGTRTATLTVTDTMSGTSESISLNGAGLAPAATSPVLSTSDLNFGNVEVGSQSSPSAVSVTAFGGDPVTITNYFSGPTPFLSSTQACSQTPCQFNVTFQPTSLGIQNGTFLVLDTITQKYALLGLRGTGGVPTVSLSTSSLTFSARNQGSISIPQTITLTNTGDADMALVSVSFAGANPGDFSIQSNTCGTTVTAGANCSIGVSFSPTASGSRGASLQIVSNATSSPDSVQLSGTGN